MYKCKLCDLTTEDQLELARHYRSEHKGTKVKVETKIGPPELVTPDQIAEALLRKIIFWAAEKETYVEQLKGMKELRSRATRLEEDNRGLREERDRLLKTHNEQVSKGSFTSTEELRRLARG